MRLKHLCLCLLSLLLATACGQQEEPEGSTQHISPLIAADISNHNIQAITEDANGQIWLATFRGLNRYDGHQFYQYFYAADSTGLPDNNVLDLLVDSRKRLWLATGNGICRHSEMDNFPRIPIEGDDKACSQLMESPDGTIYAATDTSILIFNEQAQCFQPFISSDQKRNLHIRKLLTDTNNRLWMLTGKHLYGYDKQGKCFFTVSLPSGFDTHFADSYLDRHGKLWLGCLQGLLLFDVHTQRFCQLPACFQKAIAKEQLGYIRCIQPYTESQLLLVCQSKILLYDEAKQTLVQESDAAFPFNIPSFSPRKIFIDSRKNVWMGSADESFVVGYNKSRKFNNQNKFEAKYGKQPVTSVAIDRKQNIWIATKKNGLVTYNPSTQDIREVALPGQSDHSPYYLYVDSRDHLWTTNMQGVAEYAYDGQHLHLLRTEETPLKLCATEDKYGTVWFGGNGNSLLAFHPDSATCSMLPLFPPNVLFVAALLTMKDGSLVAGGYVAGIKQIDPATRAVTDFPIPNKALEPFIRRPRFIPTSFFQDSMGDVWLGLVGNGLLHYDIRTRQLERMENISCSDISSFEEDKQGNVWISTMYGLNKYDRSTGEVIQYYEADGIGGNQFFDRASCKLSDGTLVFGGTHGITLFNPADVTETDSIPVLFQSLRINNQLVKPRKGGIIEQRIENRPVINLNHRQNSFTIGYSDVGYSEYENAHFFYKLDGVDKMWIDGRTNHEATYANLPTGCYTFCVKIADNIKQKPLSENSICIIVHPAPWNTWWAWTIYIICAVAAMWYFVVAKRRNRANKLRMEMAEREKEQEQRVNQMNMQFFANVSHEFRTPLTMIAGPIDILATNSRLKGNDARLIGVVKHSIRRMLRLVNQIMDFNKLENDTLRLNVQRMDIIQPLCQLCDIFLFNAEEKHVTLVKHGFEGSLLSWIDVDKLDKIVSNLLSNAMKFTPSNGQIDISLDVLDDYIQVVVADTGKGIPDDQLENIFKRYYQLDNQTKGIYNWGTGIGLYYARRLAELHHGSLTAANRTDGSGAVFTLRLPMADETYSMEERAIQTEQQEARYPIKQDDMASTSSMPDDDDKPLILVVDDDADVVNYLRIILSPNYRVVYRFNAEDALKAMGEDAPSLVLSDVVMPGMDGYAFCNIVKGDNQLCHIPIILVTAKTTVENQIEGLEKGADAYITKPFEPKLLLALIKSQLENREKVRQLLNQSTNANDSLEKALGPQDQHFMTELYKLMDAYIMDAEIDVAQVALQLGMSRTKFYYKMKGLTGTTPNVFFRTYKLNRAASLLREGRHTVSEVAYLTGFSSPSFFSTSFRKQFGVAPSEFK